MNISVISYAFHQMAAEGTMDIFGYLETCKYRYRLSTADIWNGMLDSLDEAYLLEVKEALEERELTLINLAVDGAHIWEDDAAAREANYQSALAHLRAAEILGAKTVRIDAGGSRDDLGFTDEQFEHVVERYTEFAERAHDEGYKVGPENHWGPEDVPGNLKRICEAVDNPAFGVLLHVGRWKGADAARGDEIVAPWVMHTHLTPASSDAELKGKMEMLRDSGYDGCWGTELVGTYAEVALHLAKVRRVLETWRLEK